MKVVEPEPRAVCERCLRPTVVCVCALLPSLRPATRVLIVQHPRERRVAIGTARMAARCLAESRVVTATDVDRHPAVVAALADPTRRAILLWPGPDAKNLATEPPEGPVTLVAVDGTWFLAKKLLRLNPRLAALPKYGLPATTPSEYRIRREPRAECLSTIEALSRTLGVLERDPEPYRAMMVPFREMIDRQLVHMARGGHPRDRSRLLRRRALRSWKGPSLLADLARVVVVAVESNAWPLEAKDRHPDELVHWLAVRGDGSARTEVVVRPTHPLAPHVTAHTGLSAEELLGGAPREALAETVRAFLREGDVLATWGTYATSLTAAAGLATGHPWVDLRRVAADRWRRAPGPMEGLVARLGLDASPLGRARGGRRVGQMVAVLPALARPT